MSLSSFFTIVDFSSCANLDQRLTNRANCINLLTFDCTILFQRPPEVNVECKSDAGIITSQFHSASKKQEQGMKATFSGNHLKLFHKSEFK